MPTSGIFAPYLSPRGQEDAPSIPHARTSADIEDEDSPPQSIFVPHESNMGRELPVSEFKAVYMPQFREEPSVSHTGSFLFRGLPPTDPNVFPFRNKERSPSVPDTRSVRSRVDDQYAASNKGSSYSRRQDARKNSLHIGEGSQYKLSIEGFPSLPVPSLHPAGLKPNTLDKVLGSVRLLIFPA
jgi:hypothetical protein